MVDIIENNSNPYSMDQQAKESVLLADMNALTRYHQAHCPAYAKLLQLFNSGKNSFTTLDTIPYLPVNLFKTQKMISIPETEVFKILQSSGTTSSHPSRIFLDAETAHKQTLALANIMTSFLGPKRLPMLVLDQPHFIKDRHQFNARGAAILGMLNFGRDVCYAFNEAMKLDLQTIQKWLKSHQGEQIFLFGLTSIVWEHFLSQLSPNMLHLPESILIHSGGWKKLLDKAVSNAQFKAKLLELTGIKRCHNFYGMVEQVGSIFMECENGHMHSPQFADVIMRHPQSWQASSINEIGVIQVLSNLPKSYPGHSLLTEDLGKIVGIDDCPCGRKGKYFDVQGRVPQAEIRGCSDTYNSIKHEEH